MRDANFPSGAAPPVAFCSSLAVPWGSSTSWCGDSFSLSDILTVICLLGLTEAVGGWIGWDESDSFGDKTFPVGGESYEENSRWRNLTTKTAIDLYLF